MGRLLAITSIDRNRNDHLKTRLINPANLAPASTSRCSSADTAAIVNAALDGLKGIYREGFKYVKAGVMLLDLQPDHQQQWELDLENDLGEDRPQLMTALDGLNQRYGKGTVLMGSAGLGGDRRAWSMKQERRTPGYTTRWVDIPVARA